MADQNIDVPVTIKTSGVDFANVLTGDLGVNAGFDYDTVLYLSKLTINPSYSFIVAVNNLIVQLKADGNWQYLDRLWLWATEYQQHSFVSIKNPNSAIVTAVNSPAWVVNRGYTSNGSTSYLNLNYNPSIDFINFTQNDSCLGTYLLTNASENRHDMGHIIGGNVTSIRSNNGGNANLACNQGTSSSFPTATALGLTTIKRVSSTATPIYKNSALQSTSIVASVPVANGNLFGLCQNSAGTPAGFSTKQQAIAFVGGGSLNVTTFYNAIQAFATARGFNV